MRYPRTNRLYRYSEFRWLERSLKLGEFRLRPASAYLAQETAAARRDDEMRFHWEMKKGSFELRFENYSEPIETIGDVLWESTMDRDYYVLSFSEIWDSALFSAFEGSDACLILNYADAFHELFHTELLRRFPDWVCVGGPISYGTKSAQGLPFTKPLSYATQSEYRFILVPPEPMELQSRLIRLGDLRPFGRIVDSAKKPYAV